MLSLICGVFLLVAVVLAIWVTVHYDKHNKKSYNDDMTVSEIVSTVFSIIFGLAFLGCLIGDLCLISKINTANKYDYQIAIVEEENAQMEEQICSAVMSYMKHEGEVFESIDITVAIGLFSIYPNLKSSELVSNLIQTYQSNATEIKRLKLEKANVTVARWLVHFGH